MKKYYIIGAIAAAAFFVLTVVIIWCIYLTYMDRIQHVEKAIHENGAVLRYYDDENLDSAEIIYLLVRDTDDYRLETIPHKTGYDFLGLFEVGTDRQYVTSDGYGMLPLSGDVLLYAKFIAENR